MRLMDVHNNKICIIFKQRRGYDDGGISLYNSNILFH